MNFFVDNPRNDVGIQAETNITTLNDAGTSVDGEGAGVDVPNPLAVESQVVVEGSHPNPVGEFFLYCATMLFQ